MTPSTASRPELGATKTERGALTRSSVVTTWFWTVTACADGCQGSPLAAAADDVGVGGGVSR
jgi:hypothetical protein